jgi:glycosyltransferase involved in cell wall biosynthesis
LGASRDEHVPVESDVVRLGLAGRVHFVDELSDPADLFAAMDVLCVTSREDPYPLVMLEAASLGVPVVSFDNGGATEFAGPQHRERRAVIVPYLDVEAMATAVAELVDDDAERLAVGKRGQERVLHEHTVEVGSAVLHAELVARVEAAARRVGAVRP